MKKIITAMLAFCAAIVLSLPVFASEEAKCGFAMRNIGPEPVTITITNLETEEKEEVVLQGQEQKTQEYAFTEPGTARYLLEDHASPEKHSYTVELFVETDEEGKLMGYAVSWLTGSAVKPEELIFGSRPPAAQTGDAANPLLYLFLCAGALTMSAAVVLFLRFRKKKRDIHAETKAD